AAEHLYSFVKVPQIVNVDFLGFIHLMTPHNILLTLLVAGLQYAAARLTVARTGNAAAALPKEKQMAHHMQRTMMLYFFPLLMAAISYSLPAAVGIYFAAGNIVSLGQELIIKRQLARKGQA
ncbi:MAG TPA: YidC/Oxa1 family membrane protein insertase, partial [Candidatus Paceibacterota bacterium]|nr:YidC/Oxa1 family membrane protein insertase [Candidatus Paceibacterota bacterium]